MPFDTDECLTIDFANEREIVTLRMCMRTGFLDIGREMTWKMRLSGSQYEQPANNNNMCTAKQDVDKLYILLTTP